MFRNRNEKDRPCCSAFLHTSVNVFIFFFLLFPTQTVQLLVARPFHFEACSQKSDVGGLMSEVEIGHLETYSHLFLLYIYFFNYVKDKCDPSPNVFRKRAKEKQFPKLLFFCLYCFWVAALIC